MGAALHSYLAVRWSAVCLGVAVLVGPAAQPARADYPAAPAPQTAVGVVAYTHDGSTVAVRPLDDPANPYRGQYGALERWVLSHAMTLSEWQAWGKAEMARMQAVAVNGMLPDDFQRSKVDQVLVTPDGWVIPDSATWTRSQEQWRQPQSPRAVAGQGFWPVAAPSPPSYFVVAHTDALPAEIQAQQLARREREQVEAAPVIPAWLGSRPPLQAVFLPNGDIMVYGELNLHYSPAPWSDSAARPALHEAPDGETWYRYSADGRLLGQVAAGSARGSSWFSLAWPQMAQTLAAFPRNGHNLNPTYHGFWVGLDEAIQQPGRSFAGPEANIFAAWTYDGRPLDLDQPVPAELTAFDRQLPQQEIERKYALEVKYGLTDPQAVSPYEDQPDGPQVADPAARPWPVVASRSDGERRSIRVLADDAPDNPYQGQYTAWDAWVWQNQNKQNPQRQRITTGHDFPEPQPVDYYGPWRDLWLPVDEHGALLPLAQAGLAEAQSRLGYDRRNPHGWDWRVGAYDLHVGGEFDAAQWTSFAAEQLRLALPLYPAVPQWLASQPAAYVVFVPNGDIVTLGPLGSYDNAPQTPFGQRAKAGYDAPYYIYGPDGQLKGTVAHGQEWTDFYRSPALKAQLAAAQGVDAQSPALRTDDGITCVYASTLYTVDASRHIHYSEPAPALVAAYDWDGTPLDITQPLTRKDFHCVMLEWHKVQWVHDVRALHGE